MKKLLLVFIGGFLMLSLSACKVPFTNKVVTIPFLEKNGEEVLKLAMEKNKEVKSFKFENDSEIDVSFVLEINDPFLASMMNQDVEVELDYSGEGAVVKRDDKKMNVEQNVKVEVDIGGMRLNTELDMKSIDDVAYIKLKELPLLPMLGIALDDIENQWIKIDPKEIAESKDMDINFDKFSKNQIKIEELQMDLQDYILETNAFVFKERLDDEEIRGIKCYHYLVSLNKDAVNGAVDLIFGVIRDAEDTDEEEAEELKGILDKIMNSLEEKKIELWIGKKDYSIYRTDFDIDFNVDSYLAKDGEIMISMNANIKGSSSVYDINTDIKIESPKDTISAIKLIEDIFGDPLKKSRNARRISDVKQMQTAFELYYNDHGRYPEEIVAGEVIEGDEGIKYMRSAPNNPMPSLDPCDEDAEYKYAVKKKGKEYELYYCISDSVGGIPAGNQIASQSGTYKKDNTPTPSSADDDVDGDGLSEYEEVFIYETDPNKSDTDGDGYSDGEEVKNGYNPNGLGKLE